MCYRALMYGGGILIAFLLMVIPASSAINTISQGNTVFIGEQGLDVSAAMGGATQVGWYRSGSSPSIDVPSTIINVGNPSSFYISPGDFSGKTGNWFRWTGAVPAGPVAFIVDDPAIRLRVFDDTANFEVRPGVTWVPTGDLVSFTIETNLYQMVQRPGVAGAPVTIRVEGPGGIEYTSLMGPSGTFSLRNIPVSSSPYSTGPVWNTRNPDYPKGNYSLWAECNANQINNNYGAESNTVTMLLQNFNPLITPTTPTTIPTPPLPTTAATTLPTGTATSVPMTTVPVTTVPVTTLPSTSVTTEPLTTSPTSTPGFMVITAMSGVIGAFLLIRRR
ncbi:MAG: DUF3821 domain-containing protein [Methanoregulaceae archaeon]|nr:DUF3821 domain-containing protein [Methanoregulaceae archaeon]